MARRPWTRPELAILRRRYPNEVTAHIASTLGRSLTTVYAKAAKLGLSKTAAFVASQASGRIRRGHTHPHMIATQFKPGHASWNKGTHFTAGGRSAETRFKPVHRSARWPMEHYPVGALRINSLGALDIKIHDGARAWMPLARFVWQTEIGPIPPGMSVRARNGDRDDTRAENLYLCPRSVVMSENSLHNYPRPIAHLYQLKGAIRRQVNRIVKNAEERTA